MAASAPTRGLAVQNVTANPLSAPISIIPSTPRLSTPARSQRISPRQAKSMAVAAPMAAARIDMIKISMLLRPWSGDLRLGPSHSYAVSGKHFPAKQKEEYCALQHRCDCCRQTHAHL